MTFQNRSVSALVPARGGSKGLPGKNLRLIGGRPLIEYTLEASRLSSYIDATHLSSDDPEILEIGKRMGARTIVRPASVASDTATATDVVRHFLEQLPAHTIDEDPYIVYLQPTSPLRTSAHIDAVFKAMETQGTNMAVSVVELKKTPYKSFTVNDEGLLDPIFSEEMSGANRQALPVAYYPSGAIYIFPVSEFLNRGCFPSKGSMPFLMSDKESIDLDSEEDLLALERVMEQSSV